MFSRRSLLTTFSSLIMFLCFSALTGTAAAQPNSAAQAKQALSVLAWRLQKEINRDGVLPRPPSGTYRALAKFARQHERDPLGPLAALALGYSDFEAERYAEAEKWLQQSASAWQDSPEASEQKRASLADYAEWYLGQTLAAEGKYAAAAEVLKDFPEKYPDSLVTENVVEKRADWLVEAGQPEKAIASLRAFRNTGQRAALLLALARAYEAAHQFPQAAEAYEQALYGYPLNDEAMQAQSALARLGTLLGENLPKVSTARRMARADTLFAARRWPEAEMEYNELARTVTGPEKEHAQVRLGACFYQEEQTGHAIQYLSALQLTDKPSEAERLFYLSQSYRTLDLENEMLVAVNQANSEVPENPWYEEILFATGNYYLLKSNDAKAVEYYRRVVETFPHGRYLQRARWKVAWNAYLTGSPEAGRLLREFIEQYPDSTQVADALYWLGRLVEKEDYGAARPLYEVLVRRFPHNYFSQDAQGRIQAAGWWADAQPVPEWLEKIPSPGPLPDTGSTMPEAARPRWEHYRNVRLIALDDLALAELRGLSRLVPWPGILLELVREAEAKGRTGEAVDALWRFYPDFFSRQVDEVPPELWRLLFPMPYQKLIRTWSRRYRLDPLLVTALIRQESAFAPQAVSSAGAVGLMQLLPATAKRLAGERRQRFRLARLTDPEYNLNYGCYYLSQLLKMFNDPKLGLSWRSNVEPALAAYNAGEQVVQSWLETRKDADAQTFVENIPYSQTRDYVQMILRNHKLYREIYSGR